MSKKAPRLWVVVGATGTGKTRLSIELATILSEQNNESSPQILNADAMQFYRGMDIGTAKIAETEKRGFTHHLFDALEVTEEATVAWYQPLAREIITEQLKRGNDVILVGGSGLYVSSVIYDFKFPPRDYELRAKLEKEAETIGVGALLKRLKEIAPEVAADVDAQNPRRVIRALELAELGHTAQVNLPDKPEYFFENPKIIGVNIKREKLVQILDARVEKMWEAGFKNEVQKLIPQGIAAGPTASRAIGYQQILENLRGECEESEAKEKTKQLTRRYARRQVSWFKRYKEVVWLDGLNWEEQMSVLEEITQ